VRYFAYGSNLSLRQMRARCPGSRTAGLGWLPDHRLEFVQPHEGWGGGVAGVVPEPGARVHGVLYDLDATDLAALDGFEPVETGGYRRERVIVLRGDGAAEAAWTYLGEVLHGAPFAPSDRYLDTILAGAAEHGLPLEYREALARRRAG
jgi:gamma-glutamylcyclotransferase (GGCT)/AIG2-like uncharacterized protein YtfP